MTDPAYGFTRNRGAPACRLRHVRFSCPPPPPTLVPCFVLFSVARRCMSTDPLHYKLFDHPPRILSSVLIPTGEPQSVPPNIGPVALRAATTTRSV